MSSLLLLSNSNMFLELANEPSVKFEFEIRNSGNSEISRSFETLLTSLLQSDGSMFDSRIILLGLNMKFSVSVLFAVVEFVSIYVIYFILLRN